MLSVYVFLASASWNSTGFLSAATVGSVARESLEMFLKPVLLLPLLLLLFLMQLMLILMVEMVMLVLLLLSPDHPHPH